MDSDQPESQDKVNREEDSGHSLEAESLSQFPFDSPASRQAIQVSSPDLLPPPSGEEESSEQAAPAPELFAALTQMLLGSTLEGGDLIAAQLREWEQQNPQDPHVLDAKANETEADRRRYALLGMLMETARRADQGLRTASEIGNSAARFWLAPLRMIGNSLPMRPLKKGVDRLAERGEQEMDRWVQKGRAFELRSRKMSQEVVTSSVDEVAGYFSSSEEIQVLIKGQIELLAGNLPSTPEMDELVKALAANYLQYLQQEPQVLQPLVKSQADEYLEYLEENPEAVQELISGQSIGLASGIRDEVRRRLIAFDYLFEKLLRAVLRKDPRWEIEEPPQAVQERAEYGWQEVVVKKPVKVISSNER